MGNSLTFPVGTSFNLSWTLVGTDGLPINNATMTATLYAGRSQRDPNEIPGTPVDPINALSLAYVALSAGLYSAVVPGTLDPPLDGVGYVLVVDGVVSGTPIYHKETPVVITTAGDTIDLTTVEAVKDRATVTSDNDNAEIQAAITGFSQHLLDWSGQSSLNSIVTLDEFYDGNGNDKLFLRTWPIRSLIMVKNGVMQMQVSSDVSTWGVFIAQSKRYIALRGGPGNYASFAYQRFSSYRRGRGPIFFPGTGNIEVQYTAGYPDVPANLEYAVRCVVAINYKRKGWQDQRSRVTSASGSTATTGYMNWKWPPEYDDIFMLFKREAIIA